MRLLRGAAVGQGDDDIVQLQAADEIDDHGGSDCRDQQRERDIAEFLKCRGSVNIRCLVVQCRNALQACQVHDHRGAAVLPAVHDRDDEPCAPASASQSTGALPNQPRSR